MVPAASTAPELASRPDSDQGPLEACIWAQGLLLLTKRRHGAPFHTWAICMTYQSSPNSDLGTPVCLGDGWWLGTRRGIVSLRDPSFRVASTWAPSLRH